MNELLSTLDLNALRPLIERMQDGVVVINAAGRVAFFNAAAERMLGVSRRARDFARWAADFDVKVDGRVPASEEEMPHSRARRGSIPCRSEIFVRNPAIPEGVWLEAESFALLKEGKLSAVVSYYRDITARRKAERASALNEQRFAKIFFSNPVGMAIVEIANGRLLTVNERLAAFFGYAREEMMGRTAATLGLWPDLARRESFIELLKARRSLRNVELTFRHRSGALKDALVSAEIVTLPDEKAPVAVWMVHDLTNLREAQRSATDYERRFKLFVETVHEYAIFLLDPNGRVATWNAGAQRIKGYGPAEAIGLDFATFYRPEERRRGAPRLHLEHAARNGRYETEGWRVRKDGSRFWASSVITALHDDNGRLKGFAKITRDLTEAKLAQEASELRRREAIHREVVANVSHELRTPIAAIRGFAETLLSGGLYDKRNRRKFLTIIHRHSERLGKLVENILHLSALDSGKRKAHIQTIVLRDFCTRFMAAYQPLLDNKGLKVKLSVPRSLKARADWDLLDEILQNLVGNAIKYNRPQGRVAIIAQAKGRKKIEIAVADTGIGIPKKDFPYLFQRFQRAGETKSVEGTGLGLSIVKKIVEGWNGRISVDSSPKGTTFRFTLPAA